MDCNREEAIRAKEIAEKKLQNNDFEGAQKLALKAQQLYPQLENISQLLAVCNVHCSAQNKIFGSEKDWYGILQVEKFADDVTIRKQYRKLALVLHPDKNKFPGAEGAFKLIGEANMVLSDKGKRTTYDVRYKVSVKNTAKGPPHQQVNRNASTKNDYSGQSNKPNYFGSQSKPNDFNHQPAQAGFLDNNRAFWTCCPFCNIKYQYYREFLNKALLCQKCSKPYIACEIGVKGVPTGLNCGQFSTQTIPSGSTQARPASSQQTAFAYQQSFKVGAQGTGQFYSPHLGSQGSVSSKMAHSESATMTGSTAEVSGGLNSNLNDPGYGKTVNEKENIGVSKVDAAMPGESRTSKNLNRKQRKMVESSESCDTSSSGDTEESLMEENGGNPATGEMPGLNGRHPRRSSRQRQNVSYKETEIDDDDFVSPPKRSRGSEQTTVKSEEAVQNEQPKDGDGAGLSSDPARDEGKIKQQRSEAPEGNLPAGDHDAERPRGNGGVTNKKAETFEVADDMLSDTDSADASEPELYECPDPEFNDFDKLREEKCFAVNQLWACYDTADCMPRFYALVKKVFPPGFKLKIAWLEINPEAQDEINWIEKDLPMACGHFKYGSCEETTDRLAFSHQMDWTRGRSRGSYMIYPRSGETWALFKDWDIGWSSEPEKHRKYEFEIVEVLSDFVRDAGIRVSYLRKVKGFVSLFQKTSQCDFASVLIPTQEMLRFSHKIPSFRMTGREREGVPAGCFELDPACLSSNLTECCQDDELKREAGSTEAEVNASETKSSKKDEPWTGSQRASTPKKSPISEQKNNVEERMAKLRRSPREFNSKNTKLKQVDANQCLSPDGASKLFNGSTNKDCGESTPTKISKSSCQVDKDINFIKYSAPHCFVGGKGSDEMFNDFSQNKSVEKFEIGQIWALYEDGLPKNYVQVKKIESFPLRLHVAFLEYCGLQKDQMRPPATCGTFRVQSGKARVFPVSSFSHVVEAVSLGGNKFEICPRKGEIWALYRKWDADISRSLNGDYKIVEILEENEQCIKVSTLDFLCGYKSVFKSSSRRQRSSTGIVEIPRGEVSKFSHQIPAFQLTGGKDGHLGGLWELDPASIPRNYLV